MESLAGGSAISWSTSSSSSSTNNLISLTIIIIIIPIIIFACMPCNRVWLVQDQHLFPHYSMIIIIFFMRKIDPQTCFLSLTTLLTSSVATTPRVNSPTINRINETLYIYFFLIVARFQFQFRQVDSTINALTGWILIQYFFIVVAAAASAFLLVHR